MQPTWGDVWYEILSSMHHTFSFIELLNRGRHSALWKWRPPRHDGRRFRARLWIDLVYLVLLLLTAGPLNPLPFPSHNP